MFRCFVEGVCLRGNRLKDIVDLLFVKIGSENAYIFAVQTDKGLDESRSIGRGLRAGGETFIEGIDDEVRVALCGA